MSVEISPRADHRPESSNQNNCSSFTISPDDLLASQLFIQPNSAQSSHANSVSIHKSKALHQIVDVARETRGKHLNFIKAPFKHYFSTGNKSKSPPSLISSNLAPLVNSSSSAAHVGPTAPEGTPHGHPTARAAPHLNPRADQELNEHRPKQTGTLPPIPHIEHRKARTIQNLPDTLRRQVAATPEHFHDMILQAYNKPSRRPPDLRHRHVRYNPRLVAVSARTYCGFWSAPPQVLPSSR